MFIFRAHRSSSSSSSSSSCDLTGFCICFFTVIIMTGIILGPILSDMASCSDNDPNSISASVSLAKAGDYYNNTIPSSSSVVVFAFNVHIELQPFGATRYRNTTVFLRHDGTDIDEYPIAGGPAVGGEGRRLDVLLKLNGSDPVVVSDAGGGGGGGGVVRLQMQVRFSPVNSRFDKHPFAEANCELALDLESRMLGYNECTSRFSCKG